MLRNRRLCVRESLAFLPLVLFTCCFGVMITHGLPSILTNPTEHRVAVAPSGTTVLNEEGEEMELKNTSVGGVVSEGMLCDSRMLGWQGGAAGLAVQIPASFELGSSPPASKPRGDGKGGEQNEEVPQQEVKGLYEKKLTKEEKKKLAEEKRKARKAAKEAKKAAEEAGES